MLRCSERWGKGCDQVRSLHRMKAAVSDFIFRSCRQEAYASTLRPLPEVVVAPADAVEDVAEVEDAAGAPRLRMICSLVFCARLKVSC